MAETAIPTRQQVADMLRERQIGSRPQRPTVPRLPAMPQTQAPVYDLDRAMAALGAGTPDPSEGGGGVMGTLGKVLGAIDMPRAFIASGLQETVDMFQGEGFSTSDLMQQTRDHHGFGDIIADMNLDFGLGGWGNKIVGFAGDVITDPLMWVGGLGAFSRARGARGLINDVALRRKELKDLVEAGTATSKNTAELNALNDLVTAAGKYRTVSAARNALMQHKEVGKQLVQDLGIETGLRFRVPGTGPILGGLSRNSRWVANRRAGQVPEMVANRVKRDLPDDTSLDDLIRKQMKRETLGDNISEDLREVVARAANVPVDILPFGTFPIAAGVTARIMGSPGVGFERMATSKVGESFKRFLVDDQKQVLNRLRRSGNPDDVIVGNLFRYAYNRGSTVSSLWSDQAQKNRQGFLNEVRSVHGIDDSVMIGKITSLPDEMVDDILAGVPLTPAQSRWLAEQFPGEDLTRIATIKKLHTELVSEKDAQFLFRDDLWFGDPAFRDAVDGVMTEFGGYTPQMYSEAGIRVAEEIGGVVDDVDEALPFLKDLLDDSGKPIRAGQTGAVRQTSRHMQNRSWRPQRYERASQEFPDRIVGGEYKIPIKGGGGWIDLTLRRPYKHADGTRGPARGGRTPFEETPLTDVEREFRRNLIPDEAGRSIPDQIDDAMRSAGWLEEGESIWIRGFAERERAYINSMSGEIRLRAIEKYAEKQGILFDPASMETEDLRLLLAKIDTRGHMMANEMAGLNDEVQARRGAVNAVLKDLGASSFRTPVGVEDIQRWLDVDKEVAERFSKEIATAQRELADAVVETELLEDQLATLISEASATLQGLGIDGATRFGDPTILAASTPAAFTVDAVRTLLPRMDELDKILVRYNVLKTATDDLTRLRETITESYRQAGAGGPVEKMFSGVERLSVELNEHFSYIEDSVLPLLRDKTGQLMSHDKSVQTLVDVMDSMTWSGAASSVPPTQVMRQMGDAFGRLFYPQEGMNLGQMFAYSPPAEWGLNPLLRRTLMDSTHPNKQRIASSLDDIKKFRDDVFRRTGNQISVDVRLSVPEGMAGASAGVFPSVMVTGRLAAKDSDDLARLMEKYLVETVYTDAFRSGMRSRLPQSNRLRFTMSDESLERARSTWASTSLSTDVPVRLTPDDFADLMETYRKLEDTLNHNYLRGMVDEYATIEERLAQTLGDLETDAEELFGSLVDLGPAQWSDEGLRNWLQRLRTGPAGVSAELSPLARGAAALAEPKPTVELGNILKNMDEVVRNTQPGQEGALLAQYAIRKDLEQQVVNLQQLATGTSDEIDAIKNILLRKKQLELNEMGSIVKAQADAAKTARGLFGPKNGKLFNLNSFGGSIDFDNLTVEALQDLFSDTRHMWGAWRIAGDERFASQVQEAMLAAQRMNDKTQVKGLLGAFDKVHNWMKAQMVATPGFVLRNLLGGTTNMWFAGIPPLETLKTMKLLKRAYSEGGGDLLLGANRMLAKKPSQELKNFVTLLESGVHSGGQAASVVESALMSKGRLDFVYGTKTAKPGRGKRVNLDPTDAGFVLFSSIRHANTFAEEAMRIGTGLHAMRTGGTLDDAIDSVYRLHFNYGDLSKWERDVGRRLMPFYTWTRNNLPLQMEFVARYPKRFNQLNSLKRNLEHDEEREGAVPDYFMRPFGLQLPFSIGGATAYSVPDMPFQDLMRFDPTSEGTGHAVEQLVSGLTPMLKAPIEYWAGKKVFAGIPYSGRFQKVPKTMSVVPGLMPALGALGFAEKNSAGDWMMQDFRIGLVDNLLPYVGRMRRIIPSEERYQDERLLQTLLSTLAGVNLRLNTPKQQENALRNREIRAALDQRNLADIEMGRE